MNYYIKPWEHQRRAIEFGASQRDLALFFEVGTGKTATVINIIRHKWQENERIVPTLILAPVVVLETWRDEFARHAGIRPETVLVLTGTGKKKAAQLDRMIKSNPECVVVTNYESMQNELIVEFLAFWRPQILVCDESHRCKAHNGKRAKTIASLAKTCKHRYILTGTPVLNTPMDLFQQFNILDAGETFGSNFWAFKQRFFFDKNAHMPKQMHFPDWKLKPGAEKMISDLISIKSLKAKKSECLDLPPFLKETRYVTLNKDQEKAYKEMRDDFITFIKGKKESDEPKAVIATLAITKALRLQQIVSGHCTTEAGETISFGDTPRLKELKSLLEELTPENKVIVWACFKQNYKEIASVCEALKIGYNELHGDIKVSEKNANIKAFRTDDDIRVIIANPASAGVGVNLIEASYSVYYSRNFSLEADIQSEARNYRGGSECHTKVTRIDLVARGTIDEQITHALANKQNVADLILDWEI